MLAGTIFPRLNAGWPELLKLRKRRAYFVRAFSSVTGLLWAGPAARSASLRENMCVCRMNGTLKGHSNRALWRCCKCSGLRVDCGRGWNWKQGWSRFWCIFLMEFRGYLFWSVFPMTLARKRTFKIFQYHALVLLGPRTFFSFIFSSFTRAVFAQRASFWKSSFYLYSLFLFSKIKPA